MPEFFDTHAHLTFPDFADETEALLERARVAGITRVITIGTDLQSSRQAVALAQSHDPIYAVVGWHPNDLKEAPEDVRPELRDLASHSKVVALGETGLDHYRLPSTRGGTVADDDIWKRHQVRAFRQQLELAAELNFNVVIHQRAALQPTLDIFEEYAGAVRGQFHCFVDGDAEMRRIIELNSLVSFTGIVTFKNASEVRATAAATPAGKYMLETDSPFLAPVPWRGKRCEPAYVREVADSIAEARQCTLEEVSQETCAAAREFFARLA